MSCLFLSGPFLSFPFLSYPTLITFCPTMSCPPRPHSHRFGCAGLLQQSLVGITEIDTSLLKRVAPVLLLCCGG